MSGLSSQLSNIKTRLKEAGNVLFMILIAVALFAALAYAVTNSTRSTGGDTSRETTVLSASQIVQYGTEIQTSIMRMKISNGCTNEQISFENINQPGLYVNPNSPANYTCHVFRPEGGAVVWRKFNDLPDGGTGTSNYRIPTFHAKNDITGIGTNCTGSLCAELVFVLAINQKSLCEEINKSVGNSSVYPLPAATGWIWLNAPFTGVYDGVSSAAVAGFSGWHTGCHAYPTAPMAGVMYHVLIAR